MGPRLMVVALTQLSSFNSPVVSLSPNHQPPLRVRGRTAFSLLVAVHVATRLLATIYGWVRHERLEPIALVRRLVRSRVVSYAVDGNCQTIEPSDFMLGVGLGYKLATRMSPAERTWFLQGDIHWGPGSQTVLALLIHPTSEDFWRLPSPDDARTTALRVMSPDEEGGWAHDSLSLGHFRPPRLHLARSVEIWHSRFIVQESKLLLSEGRSDPRQDFVSGISTLLLEAATPGTEPEPQLITPPLQWDSVEQGLFACGRADANWFHWIVDHLPQLYRADIEVDPDVPFLVQSHLPEQVYETLAFLSDRNRVEVPADLRLRVESLHVPIYPGCVTDSPNIDSVSGVFDVAGLRGLRQALHDRDSGRMILGRTIFTARNSPHRKLRNQEAVHEVLETAQLQQFHPARSRFVHQLSQYRNTDLLVAEGGADLAAMVMMTPGSHVVGLVSDAKGQADLWAELAKLLEIKFTPIVGIHDPNDSSVHASFTLPKESLEALEEVIHS